MTNILRLPLVEMEVETGTNEDWLDSVAFVEGDDVTPISIAGISFASQLRHSALGATAYLDATTDNTQLLIGGTSSNVLSYNVPTEVMERIAPGSYVSDIVATGDGRSRVVAQLAVTIVKGITR